MFFSARLRGGGGSLPASVHFEGVAAVPGPSEFLLAFLAWIIIIINYLINSINQEINKMAIWFKANKLAVNKTKTKFIIFRSKGKKIPINIPQLVYNENDNYSPNDLNVVTFLERYHDKHELNDCRAYKLLGIYLDEHLTFDKQVSHTANKLNRSLYCIRMAKHNLNLQGLRSLYFALIHSHLSYCPTILNCLSTSNKNKLAKIQKKAIRIITKSRYNDHTAPLFIGHKILPLDKIIKKGKLNFMHSVYYNYSPKSFENVWTKNEERLGNYQL